MPPPSLEHVVESFSHTMLRRGRAYQDKGRVVAMDASADGGEITGRVRGSYGRIYDVRVTRHGQESGRETFETRCDCPIGTDCKHAAALLLEAIARPQRESTARIGNKTNGRRNGHARHSTPVRGVPQTNGKADKSALPLAVTAWLEDVDRELTRRTADYPPQLRQRLLYLLIPEAPDRGVPDSVFLKLASARLRKDGTFGAQWSRYTAEAASGPAPVKFLRQEDLDILRRLRLLHSIPGRRQGVGEHSLCGREGAEILEAALATGRCRWGEPNGPLLSQGPTRAIAGTWRFQADGQQRFRLDLPQGVFVLPVTPPWYVDPDSGECGPIDSGLDPAVAAMLLRAPPLEAEAATEVRSKLAERLPERPDVLPRDPDSVQARRVRPTPRLHLTTDHYRLPIPGGFGRSAPGFGTESVHRLPAARLSFDYEGTVIRAESEQPGIVREESGRVDRIPRDTEAESAAFARLQTLGFGLLSDLGYTPAAGGSAGGLDLTPGPEDPLRTMLAFSQWGAAALRAEGWSVEIDPDFPLQVSVPDAPLEIAADDTDEGGWFDLHLGVQIDGERVDLLPILLRYIQNWTQNAPPPLALSTAGHANGDDSAEEDTAFLQVDDNRMVAIPTARIAPIVRYLWELMLAGRTGEDGRLQLSRVDAAGLAESTAAAEGIAWTGSEALRELGRKLAGFDGIRPGELPPGFAGALRPYQQEGADWLQFLAEHGLGGVLADDMGLGKTVQTLAHIAAEKAAGRLHAPTLIVAPTSVVGNWRREAGTFTPELSVLVLHGPSRKEAFDRIADSDLVVTSYPLLVRDVEHLTAQEWHAVVLDEAQTIKNPKTAMARAACRLPARHRIALSGTPIENNLTELWSLFRFLNPGLFPDQRNFTRHYRTPIEKHGDQERQASLVRRCRPFVLRRTKAAVAAELPPKSETVETVELERDQRDLYEAVRLTMHKKVRDAIARKGLAQSHIIILDALLKLRQACCDPRLVKSATAKQKKASAKLARLRGMLAELVAEDRQVLVFSQFTSMLELIAEALRADGLAYTMLTGQTSSQEREAEVARFQQGAVPIFLVSLKAGGTGLNLTAADTVIHYDPWWNPAVEAQATDRAHRIGQTRAVFVHKLIAQDTVEEKILDLHARKRALAESLFAPGTESAYGITTEDLDFLFSR